MNELTDENYLDASQLTQVLADFDRQFKPSNGCENDEQVRRIHHARQWRPDKLRTCKPAPIVDGDKNNPLIAIRLQLIARKSLGGIQTNLDSQVLTQPDVTGKQETIDGLYAIGEAAGFGGGGMHGHRSRMLLPDA